MCQLLAYSAKCCVDPCAVPIQFRCFFPELKQEYCRLFQRYQCQMTKNKRIWSLAEPKWRNQKFRQPCMCPEVALRKVEIIRSDQPSSTRTEQLAYPQVSRLLELKRHASFSSFDNTRKELVNRTLRKSLLSLYSRLSNVRIPTPEKRVKKWSENDWDVHLRRIKELAKAKHDPLEKKPTTTKKKFVMAKPGPDLRRFKKLAKPKTYEDNSAPPWQLTNYMRTYTPSKRILEMARPKFIDIYTPRDFHVNKHALAYKASQRIKELATPSSYYQKVPEPKANPFFTSKKALKAKASKRVVQLAEPKDYFDNNTRANPYRVSPHALKAKLTPRLQELSRPREYVKL